MSGPNIENGRNAGERLTHLGALVERAVDAWPQRVAIEDERGVQLTYAELGRWVERIATRLARWGVGREDRVGVYLPKSIESVCALHGVLRSGAAYVPVDPSAPPSRAIGILADAGVRAVIVAAALAETLRREWPGPGPLPRLIIVGEDPADAGSVATRDDRWAEVLIDDSPTPILPTRHGDDLAYILYTSGSTGRPKGVMISHTAAIHFLNWCHETFRLQAGDRFSSHAPFHFDLSVFDLYACCRVGGTLVLVGEGLGKDPAALGGYLADRRIDVWYSAPSILALLTQYGGLERDGFPAPRLVLFAGEVFPMRHLRRLRALWPQAELWNLYGPTETNVCNAFRVPDRLDPDEDRPLPIGPVIGAYRGRVADEEGDDLPPGTTGELLIAGPGVMRGYFGRPDLDAGAFRRDEHGVRWYRTGDLVTDDGQGCYTYHGRRDRMVKRRGYRIELGEIEAALNRHEDVERAAVLARSDDSGVAISAYLAMKPGRKASIITMKRHCSTYLPNYMVPDAIAFLPGLPMTSTDKVDYQNLARLEVERKSNA